MSLDAIAYAATSRDSPLERITLRRRPLGPHDVLIRIAFSGICHSDLHTVLGDWGEVPFPLVVGHEIAGIVEEIGSAVTRHAVGDRVGVGCMVGSCGRCENCLAGSEQHCLDGAIGTYGAKDRDGSITQGGYSTHIVATEEFVLSIPEQLSLADAAPLLCAGITTFSPLRRWNVGTGTRVAIVGLGGLGHMAVKFARHFGAHVTVLSRSVRKTDDALQLGAHEFFATEAPGTFSALMGTFDVILNTVSAPIDVDAYLALLRLNGVLVTVGMPGAPASVDAVSLITNGRAFAGSGIGGISETQEMLDYAAANQVRPETEIVSADEIDDAWKRLASSDVRYRFVIDASTII